VSLAAVGALIGTGEHRAQELLHTLTDVHLVQETARDRYQLHDLLRAYALERARADEPAGERDAAIRRVLGWYLHTADAADRILMPQRRHVPLDPAGGPAGAPTGDRAGGQPSPTARPGRLTTPRAALKWCEAERLNLVAATRYAAETNRYDVAWKLPVALWSYFNVCSRWGDWLTSHDLGLAAARRGKDYYGESLLLVSIANAYRDLRRYDEAFDRFDRAIALSRQIGEPWVEAAACTLLGVAHRDLGRLGEARLRCQQALRLFRAQDDCWGTAWALYTLGEICQDLRLHDQAIEHAQQALALFENTDDEWGKGRTLSLIGQIYRGLRRYDKATDYCRRALAAAREISDQGDRSIHFYTLSEALALYTLGKVQYDTGQYALAGESWHRALSIFEQLGAPQATKARARLAKLQSAPRR
jgi:tetratricopeptide (TPR) repeat protein